MEGTNAGTGLCNAFLVEEVAARCAAHLAVTVMGQWHIRSSARADAEMVAVVTLRSARSAADPDSLQPSPRSNVTDPAVR
jgi:hypothetical protein